MFMENLGYGLNISKIEHLTRSLLVKYEHFKNDAITLTKEIVRLKTKNILVYIPFSSIKFIYFPGILELYKFKK